MKKINELQSYLTRLRGLMLTLIILCSIGSGNAWGQASVNTVLWGETWTGATTATSGNNNATPSSNYGKGTTVYNSGTVTYTQSANTVYVRNENLAGGSKPELMLSRGKTWTINNIPTGGATELTLTYKSNNTKSSVTCSTDGVNINGSSKSYTIDNSTAKAATITLVFGCSGNTRIDDVELKVKTAGGGGGGSTPTITTSASSLSEVGYSTADFSQQVKSFTVSGSSLTENVTVTAPTNYEVCKTSDGTYTSSVTFDKGSGTLSASTVYVRLKSGKTAGNYSGNISCTSNGAKEKTVALSGSVPFTVTWSTPDDANYAKTYVAYATAPGTALGTLPSDPSTSCGGRAFYGWFDGVSYSHASDAPSIISTSTTITSDKTFIAVFATRSGSGAVTWDKVTNAPSDWSGDYVIVASSTANAMISDFHSGTSGEFKTASVTINASGTQITSTPSDKMIWTFSKNGVNAQYSLKNKSTGTYAKITGKDSQNAALDASAVWFTIESASNGIWDVASVTNSSRCFGYYSSNSSFRTYAKSSSDTGRLFKKSGEGYTWSDFVTTCAACSSDPVMTSATAALKGAFSLTSVGVTVTGCAVGTNCSWTDYGFVWGTSANPTVSDNKVPVGTSGSATTWVGTLTGSFTTGTTYHYRAYGKNGYAGGTYQYSSDQTFTPRSVTFNLNGHGSAVATQIVKDGAKAAEPSAPTADGYRFDGWYTDNGVWSSAWNFGSNTVSSNVTLYAKWTQVYTVTYNYNGGSGSCVAGGPYAEGETVTTCAAATKAGSTLTGWRRSDNGATVTPGNPFAMPAADVTLTAQWTDREYTLTQTVVGSHTTKGHKGIVITSGMTSPSGLDLTYSISDNSFALPKTVTISGGGQDWTLGTNYTWVLSADKHSATLHIVADLTISADVTITVTEQDRYTVVWDEHGNTTTDYYAADDNNVAMKGDIADCGEKKFYGWTEDAGFVSNQTTPPTMASSGTISSNKHYYAIFGDKAGGDGFVLVTSISAGEGYYMATGLTGSDKVYTGQKATNDYGGCTANNSTGSSFSGETLLAFPPEAKSLTVAISNGNFSLYDGTSYLGAANSNSLTFNDDPVYEWKLSDNKIQSQSYTSRYIKRNTANDRVCAYASTTGVADMHLYKPNVSWTNFAKTCTLYNITINTPSGGTVTTTPAAGTGVAGEGQKVTVNVTPNSCKYLSALKYNDGSDHAISIASTPYTFTMPASDVTVTATFADKSVTSIAVNTSTHRTLMQNTSFVGEQIRVTYNNGETEYLAWDDASLTFSGYTMSTLGSQTVNVAYSGSCGSANTSYEIEITDGIPVTYNDCGNTTVRKYDPGDVVPVETTAGEYACSGWEFVGWSESSVAANSTSFTPVRNFTASSARTLYAVYANVGTDWISAFNTSELRGGATYVIVYRGYSYDYALLNTVASTNYLNGQQLATACSTITESGSPSKDRYVLKDTPTAAMKWQLVPNGDYYSLYNAATNKYLKITTDQHALLTSSCDDKFTVANGYNDSQLTLKSFNASASNYYLYWYNSGGYFEGWTTAQGLFLLTNVKTFSSNPPCAPRSVTFHGNGGTVTASGGGSLGENLVVTEAARDAGINLPTASIDAEDCEGNAWNFFGWIDHPVDVTRVPILTTDMLKDGYNPLNPNPHYDIVTDNDEFWAVYANTGEPETKYGTISFTMNDFSLSYSSTENTTRKTVTNMGEYAFGYVNLGHSSQKGIEFKENAGELYNKTSLGKVNSISFTTFSSGDINKLKVYVGNEEKTTDHQLTAAEMQNVGSTWTYYPTENESYFYITNVGIGNGSYVCVSGISVDFGQGTTVYATTPVCSTISLSGDVYVTSRNGVGIMAVTPLSVEAHQLAANADVVITSNSSDVYFSKDRNANFAKAAANQPKNSVTVTANGSGELSATTIYVHYKPSSTGTGAASDVTVYANLSPANPNIKGEHTIHVRNLPEKFVIAAKVGGAYYALPADMNTATNPSGVVIEVDEMNMTAVAPNTCSYTIWPVKTTNTENDRYALQDGNAYGERVRFAAVNNNDKALWANDAASGTTIKNWAYIKKLSDGSTGDIGEGTNSAYEWKITTTVVDGNWQYTLQTDQTNNQKYLRYWSAASGGPKWGTYASGEQNLYFLPVTEVEPFEMQVVEWYPTKVLVNTTSDLTGNTLTVRVNGSVDGDAAVTNKGSNLYEISNLDLAGNPTKLLRVDCGTSPITSCTKAIPVIISRSTQNVTDAPFTTLTKEVYNKADLVVRDNAVLTLNGTIEENTFSSVTIYPTAKISVPSDKKLTANSLTFFGGIDDIYNGSTYTVNKYGVPELSLKGKVGKALSTINYDMRVDLSQMYALALPYDVDIAAITYWDGTAMTPGTDLYISAYDGQARVNRESRTWIYETDFAEKLGAAKLKAGVGYTISAELQSGFGDAYSIIRMPMQAGLTAEATEVAKTVAVVAYANNQGATVTDNHKGWNFVGNPYMTSISGNTAGGASDAKLVVGCLVPNTNVTPWDGSYMWKKDSYRYVTIPSDDGSENWQSKWTDVTLKPFKNFFIQVATSGDLSFALASRANAPARYMQAQDHEVEFEVLLSSAMSHDHTGLLLADKYTPAYEINADLEKMENPMSVYTLSSGYKLAYNALSPNDAKQPIPVGYIADNAGIYTFELDENSNVDEVEHVWLTDYELNRVTDLMDATYEFTTVAGRNETRFALVIELKAEETIPTNINELVMDRNAEGAMKFIYNDKMYILNKGIIYDATGKRINVINK